MYPSPSLHTFWGLNPAGIRGAQALHPQYCGYPQLGQVSTTVSDPPHLLPEHKSRQLPPVKTGGLQLESSEMLLLP